MSRKCPSQPHPHVGAASGWCVTYLFGRLFRRADRSAVCSDSSRRSERGRPSRSCSSDRKSALCTPEPVPSAGRALVAQKAALCMLRAIGIPVLSAELEGRLRAIVHGIGKLFTTVAGAPLRRMLEDVAGRLEDLGGVGAAPCRRIAPATGCWCRCKRPLPRPPVAW